MQTSLFLAKLIGPVFLTMGIAILVDAKRFQGLAREFIDSEALIFLSGILTLPIGLAIVITHNVWIPDWPVIITVLGWVSIAAGISRMTIPNVLKRIGGSMTENTRYFFVPGLVTALLGLYLSYEGYLG